MIFEAFIHCTFLVICFMTLAYALAYKNDDLSIIDIAWPLGFLAITYYTFFTFSSFHARQIEVTVLITLWAVRLACHLYQRKRGKPEDPRYTAFRKKWPDYFYLRAYIQIFLVQGFCILIIAYPIILINISKAPGFRWLDSIGLAIWMIGFYFEAVGDYQLQRFLTITTNKGRIFTQGLWAYTRHPNYFGECVMWWGIFVIALSVPYGWTTIISPLFITYLVRFVSGIPLIEKQLESHPEFIVYKEKTSIFIPWLKS